MKTEMSLHVLAYNRKRLMTLLGVAGMLEVIRMHALLLALHRVFEATVVLTQLGLTKTRHSALNDAKRHTTRIGQYYFAVHA